MELYQKCCWKIPDNRAWLTQSCSEFLWQVLIAHQELTSGWPCTILLFKIKIYPIHSVCPSLWLSIDSTLKQLEFNIYSDYFDFESNEKKKFKTKFDATSNGIDDTGPLQDPYLWISQQENQGLNMITRVKLMQAKNYASLFTVRAWKLTLDTWFNN